MSIVESKINFARSTIKTEKIFTLKRLVAILECSSRTAQTKLKLWGTFTSYNQNGKYYTLPEIPDFDVHGLWRFKNVAFSKHGNLKKTIVHLITSSPAGLTGRQLGELLGLSPQSFVHHLHHYLGISREKRDGVFVYFSDDPLEYKKQIQERATYIRQTAAITISDSEAVMILVAIIKHHGISLEEILRLPEIRKSKMARNAIQEFLAIHGLVKKTPDLQL
jgi:hypothetical protein